MMYSGKHWRSLLWATVFLAVAHAGILLAWQEQPPDSVRLAIKNAPNDSAKVQFLNQLGGLYWYEFPDTALVYHRQAQELSERISYPVGLVNALHGIGFCTQLLGRPSESLRVLFQALTIAETLRDSSCLASSYNMVGNNYSGQQKHREAIRYYQRSLDYNRNSRFVAQGLGNIGIAFHGLHHTDSALVYLRNSSRLYQEANTMRPFGIMQLFLGKVYQEMGQADSALQCFNAALRTMDINTNRKFVGMAYYHLSLLQISSGEYINAREYAQKARAVLERGKFRVQMLDCYKTLSDIYAKLGDHERSLEYYKLYDALGDSLASVESSLQIAEIQGKYETATKDREIATLRAEESLQTYWRNAAILGALFAILLALLVWNRYRIKKESEASLQEKNVALRRANSAIQEQQELLAERNAELERKNLRLEELNDEKNEFLGIAAHDLKSPLASIRMNTELMLLEKISEQDLKHSIHSIQNLSSKMSELIQNLLDINAIENGGVQFYEQKLTMNVLVKQSVENYRLAAEQKNLQISLHEQPTPPVIADETALTQVLDNLLSNAVKFSHAGKGISIRVGVRADTVRVEVQDEGPGLSPDDMKKLFGKFARLSARPTGGEHSTGLGLSIVKKMVEAMNGRVWCESEVGKGATFIVEFPVIS